MRSHAVAATRLYQQHTSHSSSTTTTTPGKSPTVVVVRCDAYEDLWNKYVQAQQSSSSSSSSSSYESTVSRRERNLDHWDVSAAAAHLGLHPVTLVPLPKSLPSISSSSSSSSDDDDDVITANAIDEYVGHDSAILFYSRRSADRRAVVGRDRVVPRCRIDDFEFDNGIVRLRARR